MYYLKKDRNCRLYDCRSFSKCLKNSLNAEETREAEEGSVRSRKFEKIYENMMDCGRSKKSVKTGACQKV
jgi:hypothetical protein